MTLVQDAPLRTPPPVSRRWLVLVVLASAQLMVVLDATIVNIALPRAQADLGFGVDARQWVVTSYALAFGGLLLLGGRLGDVFGRRATFLTGLAGFAAASALGGAATSFEMLVLARAGQGVFAALLAPAALSLVNTTFTDPAERAKAFGIFGGIAGGGGALGLILGGALTEWMNWRWCLYVNVAIAVPALLAGYRLLVPDRPLRRVEVDVIGAVTVSLGLFGLVFGFANAETESWGHPLTVSTLIGGAALVAAFAFLQHRVSAPLLPLRVLADRNRGSSFLSLLVVGSGMFAIFLFLTYYMQITLGFSPLNTGLAFLPMIAGIAFTAQIATRRLGTVPARRIVPLGMLTVAAGLVWFTTIDVDGSYVADVLPGLIIAGIGLGMIIATSIQIGVSGVAATDSSVASATVNTMQQIGGSIGTAVFSTIAATATEDHLAGGSGDLAQAAVEGYTAVFGWAAGLFVLGAVVSAALLRPGAARPTAGTDASVLVH